MGTLERGWGGGHTQNDGVQVLTMWGGIIPYVYTLPSGQVWGQNDPECIKTIHAMVNQGHIWGFKATRGGPGRKPQWDPSAVALDG